MHRKKDGVLRIIRHHCMRSASIAKQLSTPQVHRAVDKLGRYNAQLELARLTEDCLIIDQPF